MKDNWPPFENFIRDRYHRCDCPVEKLKHLKTVYIRFQPVKDGGIF